MPVTQIALVSDVSFAYGSNIVLQNISFDIHENDFIALIGPNGSGKTTIIKILLGLLKPSKGEVLLNISRQKIGYVPQHHTVDRNFPGTVQEILSTKAKELLTLVGIESLLKTKFVSLSGGQQQRVLIALALKQNPELLILDEPTAGVDVAAQQSFYQLLQKLNKKGISIVLVTHEIGVISSLVKRVLCINHTICCSGKPKDVPKLIKEMYGADFLHHHHKQLHPRGRYD